MAGLRIMNVVAYVSRSTEEQRVTASFDPRDPNDFILKNGISAVMGSKVSLQILMEKWSS